MDISKRVGVLFSGGLDSTYLVWKNLKEGNTVVPFYFEIENNTDKTNLEKNRVELLRRAFCLEFPDKVEPIQYTVSVSVENNTDTLHLLQVPIWILGVLYSQHNDLSEFQIGYVMNDDAISYLNDIQKIYKSYSSITDLLVPLKFPISKKQKWMLWDELPKDYHEFIVSCEAPRLLETTTDGDMNVVNYEPCGRCQPCTKILSTNNHYNGPIKLYNKPKLNQAMDIVRYHKDVDTKEFDGRHYYIIEIEDDVKLEPEPYQLHIPFEDEIECEKEVEYEGMLKECYEKN